MRRHGGTEQEGKDVSAASSIRPYEQARYGQRSTLATSTNPHLWDLQTQKHLFLCSSSRYEYIPTRGSFSKMSDRARMNLASPVVLNWQIISNPCCLLRSEWEPKGLHKLCTFSFPEIVGVHWVGLTLLHTLADGLVDVSHCDTVFDVKTITEGRALPFWAFLLVPGKCWIWESITHRICPGLQLYSVANCVCFGHPFSPLMCSW